ncbi:response regulator [Flavobacterium sp. MAH-1]|uniref:Response regulator n=1 Tax=Flavobacterium agri TaxID=2743471 RepID=A0A7Y8Y132_9FLAO|nr:response regulator [Flavobacterium agri]NUY80455.1 response regulator [Flavobacterium agri]NYA70480.1 response regulator [Flavobacterium agri]
MAIQVILHIDDDPEDCELFQEALKAVSDAEYHAIHDAFKALTILKSGSILPEIIFLDLNMPRMDGREFLEAIQDDERLKKIPVIVLSTSDVRGMMHQTKGLHASAYLTKPTDYDMFKEVLKQKLAAYVGAGNARTDDRFA